MCDAGDVSLHQINEDLGLNMGGSPYTISLQSNMAPDRLAPAEIAVEYSKESFVVEPLQ